MDAQTGADDPPKPRKRERHEKELLDPFRVFRVVVAFAGLGLLAVNNVDVAPVVGVVVELLLSQAAVVRTIASATSTKTFMKPSPENAKAP